MHTARPGARDVTLKELLEREMERRSWSQRDVAIHTGVARTSIANILENPDVVPGLETLERFGTTFGIPLWRMVEIAGFDAGLPADTPAGISARVAALAGQLPAYREILDRLGEIDPRDAHAVLAYLEILLRRPSGDPDAPDA